MKYEVPYKCYYMVQLATMAAAADVVRARTTLEEGVREDASH